MFLVDWRNRRLRLAVLVWAQSNLLVAAFLVVRLLVFELLIPGYVVQVDLEMGFLAAPTQLAAAADLLVTRLKAAPVPVGMAAPEPGVNLRAALDLVGTKVLAVAVPVVGTMKLDAADQLGTKVLAVADLVVTKVQAAADQVASEAETRLSADSVPIGSDSNLVLPGQAIGWASSTRHPPGA